MPVSPARRIAYRVLCQVEAGRGFAADLLRVQAVSGLSEPDRSLATELVLGTLRRRAELDAWIERNSDRPLSYFDPEVLITLRLGVYQIQRLERVPKSAVVNDAVEMTKAARKRSAAGFVNAVLRKCEPAKTDAASDENSLHLALPGWLAEKWGARFGAEAARALARWSLEPSAIVARILNEAAAEEVRVQLAREGIPSTPGRFAARALCIEQGSVTRSTLWHERRLVIQEEASQLVGALVRPESGQRVLDLCAAPGMKTLQLAADLGQGLLISCDKSGRRIRGMAEVVKGLMPAEVRWRRLQLDASRPLPFAVQFDRILVDAPCSGTGTMARNPEIKWRLRPEDIRRFSEIQASILEAAVDVLAPAGRLVYATCSLEPEENEEVLEQVLANKAGLRLLACADLVQEAAAPPELFDPSGYFHTRPDLHGTDGFFAAVILRES